jgi:Ca2+/H+ antiporter, TMEM165/GDT1 family
MDLKTLGAAFTMVFLAELGDKTQIALFTMTAQGKPKGAVLLGGCAALCASTVLAVALGALLQGVAGDRFRSGLRIVAGLAFVAMGILMLLGKED